MKGLLLPCEHGRYEPHRLGGLSPELVKPEYLFNQEWDTYTCPGGKPPTISELLDAALVEIVEPNDWDVCIWFFHPHQGECWKLKTGVEVAEAWADRPNYGEEVFAFPTMWINREFWEREEE